MKRSLIITLIFCLFSTTVMGKNLNVYYISHSTATNERALVKALEIARPSEYSEDAVFYLTNSDRPVISYWGIPGEGESFQTIIDEIERRSSHEVYPYVDMEKLLEIFTYIEEVRGEYEYVILNFYIDSIFWDYYKETVIAKLYHALELADRPDFLNMNIFFTEGDDPEVDEKYPFGQKYQCVGYEFMPLTLFEN